ncbi:hypothetical protein E4T38_06997 [Aureobasidium subglaciale]|nr:hypothetical protein E4T38_06997 [Aureobasidium subglaciale]KAI5218335.1 hypothetical protein E4T40_06928 [Aureobasidium subglaciale]KAI5221924.1 hypothetical protein E4T41_06848 [Aureobasidium subglaciale]KAI5259269.1 hypothetical protein E4T46_06826 [Aureobasidium subglaciale]
MKYDGLARRAILFVAFIIATTVLYGLTTRLLFTAPNYDDVSIDPEGGSYYDYGSRVAAAVWKGAGQWMGTSESTTSGLVDTEMSRKETVANVRGQNATSTQSDALDPISTFGLVVRQEKVSRRQRLRFHRGAPELDHLGP